MSYKSAALALSPVALWMLDEASGTTIIDSGPNSQTGTYQTTGVTLGGASIIPFDGGNGHAAALAGAAGRFLGSVPNTGTIALTSFTFVMWFKFTGSLSTPAFVRPVSFDHETTASGGWEIQQNSTSNNTQFRVDTSTTTGDSFTYASATLFDGNVHMIAVGITGSNQFLSFDGGAWTTNGLTGAYAAPLVALWFGNASASTGEFCTGTYQGAAMFSGQLSAANVNALYLAGTVSVAGEAQIHLPTPAIQGRWWAPVAQMRQTNLPFSPANPPSYDQQLRPIPAVQAGMTPWQAPHIHQHNVVYQPANPVPYDQQNAPFQAVQAGMQQWWAPVVHARATTAPTFPAAQPVPYDQQNAPFAAVQSGMAAWVAPVARAGATTTPFHGATENDARPAQLPIAAIQQNWWAPVAQARATVTPFSAANPASYDQGLAPVPAVQAGMKPWQAPVAQARVTTGDVNPPPPVASEQPGTRLPTPAIQQGWWAPVPALQATNAPFQPANPPEYTTYQLPSAAIQQPWRAPLPASIQATTVPFVLPAEADAHTAQLPISAITGNQPWQAPVRLTKQHNVVFQVANPPEFTSYKIPIACIQGGWWAPIVGARSSPAVSSGPAPIASPDAIVQWRQRHGY